MGKKWSFTRKEKMMEDISKYTPMMQQYLSLKAQYKDMLVFFRLGDFYELFFADAVKTSKLLEITLTSRAGGKDGKIPMCGVPYHAAHGYIQKLIDMGEKIAIAEQTSAPTKGATLVRREVTKIITPGTFVQEGEFAANTSSYVAAVYYEAGAYALVYGDISIGKYYYVQQLQTEAALIDALRVIHPLELVYVASQSNALTTTFAQELCVSAGIDVINETTQEAIPPVIVRAFSVLETYLTSVRADSMISFQYITEVAYETTMHMNMSTIASLELFETMKTKNRQGSLLSLLDETKTSLGSRLLRTWLARPLMQQAAIDERLDIVENLLTHYIERKQLQQVLGKIYDVERIISRIAAETAGIRELHQLKQTMLALDELNACLSNAAFHPDIQARLRAIGTMDGLRDELLNALATADVETLKETGMFNAGYSAELDELQSITQGGSAWLLQLEAAEKARTGIKHLRIKYNKVFGYFIEISKGSAALVQPEWGYERKQTLTNAERFVTEELKEKEAQILGAKERLLQLERQLFLALCRQIAPYRIQLQKLADFLAWLDVLQSFAEVSQAQNYCRPQASVNNELTLRASRHPIIERVIGEGFITNDVMIEDGHTLLITGPNMAGKSTYMRQIALAAVMYQIGCFVPATHATMPIFDAIYTRIGAQDDLFAGESTFMVEMKEVSAALAHASANSLLLFDEIGRGTATFDGLSLAYAILVYGAQTLQAKTLFSTHYHELTEFTKTMAHVRNIHVSASLVDDDIIFHHRIQEGSIARSYGVQVAKLADLPSSVISEAQKLLLVLEANQPTVDETLVADAHVATVARLHEEKAQLISAQEQHTALVESIRTIDLDALSPREVVATLERLQNELKQ
jgi:DNA mismatch repair protein MutS